MKKFLKRIKGVFTKKNFLIVVLITIIGLYFFDIIGSESNEPDVVNTNTIKFHTHSLYGVDGNLFKINSDTGETHYFSNGVFIPVPTLSIEDLKRMQGGMFMTPPSSSQQMLERYD
jgi:hypothetical protein